MEETIMALVTGVIGILLLFAGYRLAKWIIPLWGLLAGFALGASAASDALSNKFLGDLSGFVAGLVVGFIFALLSYFFFELAIVLLGVSTGYWLGVSFIGLLGIQKGFLPAIIGIMIGILIGIISLFINSPKAFIVFVTSVGGTATVLVSILMSINKIQLDNLSYMANTVKLSSLWFWGLLAIALLTVGLVVQIASTKDYRFKEWRALQDFVDEPVSK